MSVPMPVPVAEFQRFTSTDPDVLQRDIVATRERLADALRKGDDAACVDHAADLGGALTTARREAEALAVLEPHARHADAMPDQEAAGWYWCAYATALQYLGRRDEAHTLFEKAIRLCRDGGWQKLQAMVHHHWGRSLVEQGRLDEAQAQIETALAMRQALGDPRQASSQRALEGLVELAELRGKA